MLSCLIVEMYATRKHADPCMGYKSRVLKYNYIPIFQSTHTLLKVILFDISSDIKWFTLKDLSGANLFTFKSTHKNIAIYV